MQTWAESVRNALTMAGAQLRALTAGEDAPYCYIYGGTGEILTEKSIRALVKRYGKVHFDKMFKETGKTIDDLIAHCAGKRGLDCSEFVWRVTGGKQDMNSTSLINSCHLIVPPASGVEGSVLYKPGHVALDLGGGMCAEMCGEFRDLEINRIKDRGFTKSGQLPWVDYRGASNM